jgi:hypothetical protein
MEGSFNEFLQMAQVSAQMSHDHIATAFHFFISNRGGAAEPLLSCFSSVSPGVLDSVSSSIFLKLEINLEINAALVEFSNP